MKTALLRRVSLARKVSLIAFSFAALSLLPVDSQAQGNSPNTPAEEKSKGKGGQGDEPGNGGTAPVPEPATWATMVTLALVGGGLAYRSMRHRRATTTTKPTTTTT